MSAAVLWGCAATARRTASRCAVTCTPWRRRTAAWSTDSTTGRSLANSGEIQVLGRYQIRRPGASWRSVPAMDRTAYRTCPLCEATCGLEITLKGDEIVSIRGDRADVFSRGFLCPKGVALKDLHDDPDRVRTPLLRQADGSFAPATWDAAFAG